MPKIQPLNIDLTEYDTVILGAPVWWYAFAPAMKTFLHDTDLSGKTVYPFATNGGWLGHTFQDFVKECPGHRSCKAVISVLMKINCSHQNQIS